MWLRKAFPGGGSRIGFNEESPVISLRSRHGFALAATVMLLASMASGQTTRPIPQIRRVMVVSIDGLRPDVMLRANTPTLHGLMRSGAFSTYAQTVPVAITLPSHVSMLTGVSVERHGITFNDERATTRPIYPNATTIFEAAKKGGLTTALVSGKSKFMALNKPGSIDWLWAPESAKTTDADVSEYAGKVLAEHRPDFMFVHFPGADTAGHASGWASPEQFDAVEKIDAALGTLLAEVKSLGLTDSTAVIVSADHGGSGKTHGANDPRSLYIPWIASGTGIRKNFDLTNLRDLTINTTDTFATACFLLGLDYDPTIDGKPLYQIVEGYELLRPTTTPARQRVRASQ
jgi:predicted AlkP superfamily pyrophosphatase or phosphodiesterase